MRQIDAWCQRERRSVPDLFIEEFGAAMVRLATLPAAGTIYSGGHRPDLRRLPMPRTRYHAYYGAERNRVAVLAVWHSRRGGSPRL